MKRGPLRRVLTLLWWALTLRLPMRLREKREAFEIRESGLFAEFYYQVTYPDIGGSGLDPVTHYVRHGALEGRNPNPLFHTQYYTEKYLGRDVQLRNPLVHYIRNAVSELPSPNPFFDAEFYIRENPSILEHDINPLLHYLSVGGKLLRSPHPDFDVGAYVKANPGVEHSPKTPLAHFFAGLGSLPETATHASSEAAPRIAVVLHLYYTELWPEIRDSLRNLPKPFDLLVSLSEVTGTGFDEEIRRFFPSAKIRTIENRGRDIAPFLSFLNAGDLDRYDYVCKIHSKVSPHRIDWHRWRGHLLQQLLGHPTIVEEILETFERDERIGIVGPATQVTRDVEYWGSNFERVRGMADRLGFEIEAGGLEFFQGSMFWFRPRAFAALRELALETGDFELESGQVDGTLAHAVERIFSFAVRHSGFEIAARGLPPQAPTPARPPEADLKLIAFYLPQFHPIPENDAWWGEGFTEWNHVVRARPLYEGHPQPRLPAELGFTDLRVSETREAQADLARAHGIHGFCYYYYWFDGKRLLERPLDEVLASGRPDFPFCICWANENWTRSWDGLEDDLLIEQCYAEGWAAQFIADVIPILRDPRYIRFDGKPVLMIYRAASIPAIEDTLEVWRRACRENGVGEIHLCAVLFHDILDVSAMGFDAAVEFPPHHIPVVDARGRVTGLDPDFDGLLYDYEAAVDSTLKAGRPGANPVHRGVMLAWDNTPRRGASAHVAVGANPEAYGRWLRGVIEQELDARKTSETLVFINAWNEWGEGAVLEPDEHFGSGFLEATRNAVEEAKRR